MKKAERDLQMARLGAAAANPPKDGVCSSCQQLSEKYLMALLQKLGLAIARTHNLEALLAELLPHFPSLRQFRRGLGFLTNFAVETRYPGKNATLRQMRAAHRWAEHVRQECRTLLGIKPRHKQKP